MKEILLTLQTMGVSVSKIGENINIHRSTLSKWLHNSGGLSKEAENRLKNYLIEWKKQIDEIFIKEDL